MTPVTLNLCPGTPTTEDGVVATCFEGSGESFNDYLFSFALVTPSPSTSINSVTLDFSSSVTDFGLVEGDGGDPCSGLTNVPCLPSTTLVTIAGGTLPLSSGDNTFNFTNFTGSLSGDVTAYFTLSNSELVPTFESATTSSTTTTPEPGEIGLLVAAFVSIIAVRRRQQGKQNS